MVGPTVPGRARVCWQLVPVSKMSTHVSDDMTDD